MLRCDLNQRPFAVPNIVFTHRLMLTILTAAPSPPSFICHRQRFGGSPFGNPKLVVNYIFHNKKQKRHPIGCLLTFWLRRKDLNQRPFAVPKIVFTHRLMLTILTAAPSPPSFICHRQRFGGSPFGNPKLVVNYIFHNKKQKRHPIGCLLTFWLRRKDLNQRPSGYERFEENPTYQRMAYQSRF